MPPNHTRTLCVTKNDTGPRPAFPLTLELSNDVNEPAALLDVTSASSNFFRLREPLTMGKQGFGLTGEDIDFMGDVFGRLTLRFETPDDGTGVRPAFLRLTHSKRSFQRLFTEEQIPLLCLEL